MKRKYLLALVLALAPLGGCSQPEPEPVVEKVEEPTKEEETKKADLTIGEEAENTKEATFENKTGETITSFKYKLEASKDFSENLMEDDEEWEEGTTLQWFYAPSKDGNVLLEIDTEDGSYVIHDFDFPETEEPIQLKLKDGVAYLAYGETDTFEAEKELAEPEMSEEEAPVQAEAQSEQPVYEEPVYQETYQEPVYQEPVYQEPVYEAPAVDSGNQSSEGCLGGDVVFND